MYRTLRNFILVIIALSLFACNGETPTAEPSIPSDNQGERGMAWVDWDYSEVRVMESYPMQVDVIVKRGYPLPLP